jgi:Na+-transporting NADH:ubiquinone oxidoreductase subunit NqrF
VFVFGGGGMLRGREVVFAYLLLKAARSRFKLYLHLYGCSEGDVECIKEALYNAVHDVFEKFGFSERVAERVAERLWKELEESIEQTAKQSPA